MLPAPIGGSGSRLSSGRLFRSIFPNAESHYVLRFRPSDGRRWPFRNYLGRNAHRRPEIIPQLTPRASIASKRCAHSATALAKSCIVTGLLYQPVQRRETSGGPRRGERRGPMWPGRLAALGFGGMPGPQLSECNN